MESYTHTDKPLITSYCISSDACITEERFKQMLQVRIISCVLCTLKSFCTHTACYEKIKVELCFA